MIILLLYTSIIRPWNEWNFHPWEVIIGRKVLIQRIGCQPEKKYYKTVADPACVKTFRKISPAIDNFHVNY